MKGKKNGQKLRRMGDRKEGRKEIWRKKKEGRKKRRSQAIGMWFPVYSPHTPAGHTPVGFVKLNSR